MEEPAKKLTKWYNSKKYPEGIIAYFSAEYGIYDNLEIYSGGLGILSGDHCKSASDLGLPFVGVGLFYKQGYFTQKIDPDGNQIALFKDAQTKLLPISLINNKNDEPLLIELDFPGRRVYAQIWELEVGSVKVYLLDSDVEKNQDSDKKITHQLYAIGKNRETRLSQEIILGMGGVRALRKLNINPRIWHLNEGHSAFLIFELIKEEVEKNSLSFIEALNKIKKHIIFTTHTPVKVGHESFQAEIIKKYFENYLQAINLDFDSFLELGNFDYTNTKEEFSMTIFALKASKKANAVSKINQEVSKEMWHDVWHDREMKDVPIDYVTNGIHHPTWLSKEFHGLFRKYIDKEWANKIEDVSLWQKARDIPDMELWNIHNNLKMNLIDFIKQKDTELYSRNNTDNKVIDEILENINPSVLTIGFARRFAPYKRATLIFRDEEKLKQILLNREMPVQIIFTGKAYPLDEEGKELIRIIYQYTLKDEFRGKIIFLENYGMQTARYLVQGVDVWLNNPLKPYEASGTSGQKAAINGVLNCSILDGWWPEAYNSKNGWAIESEMNADSRKAQDVKDSENLYSVILNRVIPCFYDRNKNNVPEKWVKMMKESIATVTPLFNTHRMVKEYCEKFYFPLMR